MVVAAGVDPVPEHDLVRPEHDLVRPEYDLVCVGGGLGGLAAAARAAALGLDVLVVEASDTVGGCGAYSGGLLWAPGAEGADPPDSVEAADAYLAYVQGERTSDTVLRREVLQAAREAVALSADLGVAFEVVPGNPDVFFPQAPGSTATGRMLEVAVDGADLGALRPLLTPSPHYRTGLRHRELFGSGRSTEELEELYAERGRGDLLTMGLGLAGAFVRAALVERAVSWRTGLRVVDLLARDGRVVGVRAVGTDGQTVEVGARRGVLLATGGYGWAEDAAALEGLPDFAEAGPPSLQGDHLRLVEQVGAGIVRGGGPQFSLGAQVQPGDVHPGTDQPLCSQLFDVMGLPHTLVVNRDGQRFGDESYYVGINEALRRWDATGKRWSNFPCYLIVDAQFQRRYRLATLPPGMPYPSSVAQADSLPELARRLGVDPDGLVETVATYNSGAREGRDPAFARGTSAFVRRRYGDPAHEPNASLGPVEEPPFAGLPLRLLGTGLCTFGVRTDADARVLRRDASPVPGLFATGDAVATTEFLGYVTGYGNTRTIAMAYRAAAAVAGRPPRREDPPL